MNKGSKFEKTKDNNGNGMIPIQHTFFLRCKLNIMDASCKKRIYKKDHSSSSSALLLAENTSMNSANSFA
jgi:hypothetical protein